MTGGRRDSSDPDAPVVYEVEATDPRGTGYLIRVIRVLGASGPITLEAEDGPSWIRHALNIANKVLVSVQRTPRVVPRYLLEVTRFAENGPERVHVERGGTWALGPARADAIAEQVRLDAFEPNGPGDTT